MDKSGSRSRSWLRSANEPRFTSKFTASGREFSWQRPGKEIAGGSKSVSSKTGAGVLKISEKEKTGATSYCWSCNSDSHHTLNRRNPVRISPHLYGFATKKSQFYSFHLTENEAKELENMSSSVSVRVIHGRLAPKCVEQHFIDKWGAYAWNVRAVGLNSFIADMPSAAKSREVIALGGMFISRMYKGIPVEGTVKFGKGKEAVAFDAKLVRVWIRIKNLPEVMWTWNGLSQACAPIGQFLNADATTWSRTRLDYARVLVAMVNEGDVPNSLQFAINDQLYWLSVEVEENSFSFDRKRKLDSMVARSDSNAFDKAEDSKSRNVVWQKWEDAVVKENLGKEVGGKKGGIKGPDVSVKNVWGNEGNKVWEQCDLPQTSSADWEVEISEKMWEKMQQGKESSCGEETENRLLEEDQLMLDENYQMQQLCWDLYVFPV